jgi:hypothetical protein
MRRALPGLAVMLGSCWLLAQLVPDGMAWAMPPVIGVIVAVGSAIGSAVAAGGVLGALVGLGISAGLGLAASLLTKNPSIGEFTQEAQGRVITSRQPAAAARVVVGGIRTGGVITYMDLTGDDNDFLHVIVTYCLGPVSAINNSYFDGEQVTVDGSGNGTGKWAGLLHLEKKLGDHTTTFSQLTTDTGGRWSANHKQLDYAHVWYRLKFDPDVYPNGLPNITADIDGRFLYDSRTQEAIAAPATGAVRSSNVVTITTTAAHGFSTGERVEIENVTDTSFNGQFVIASTPTGTTFTYAQTAGDATSGNGTATSVLFSSNAALAVNDYLTDTDYGFRESHDNVDVTQLNATANVCDEDVDLDAGGTEKRYTCNGSFLTSQTKGDILKALLTAMGGQELPVGGTWYLYAAAWRAPSLSFDESDIRGDGIRLESRHPRRDLFNAVKGLYVSSANDWQPSDFPPFTNSTYETEDNGERIFTDINLPFTTSATMAQRLAKIALERHRQQKTVQARFGLKLLEAAPPDVIQLSNDRWSFTNKAFEIEAMSLVSEEDDEGVPELAVEATLRETASSVYSWDETTEEQDPTTPGSPVAPTLLATGEQTHRPLSNPLTATDAGSDATVSVAAFTMRIQELGDISINSGSVTALSFDTLYHVYYADPDRDGGAVTYAASTTKEAALDGYDRFYVGSIRTPVDGGSATVGNNDGGTGSQFGQILLGSPNTFTDTDGTGFTNPDNVYDLDTSTKADRTVNGGTSDTQGTRWHGVPGLFRGPNTVVKLKVDSEATYTAGGGAGSLWARLWYSVDGGSIFTPIYQQNNASRARQIDSVTLAVSDPTDQVQVKAQVSSNGGGDAGQTVAQDVYEAWLEVSS